MRCYDIKEFTKGWFIGPFEPSLFKTNQFECAVKSYVTGDKEVAHVHKLATEYTVVAVGSVRMNGIVYHQGSIIEIKPNEATDFEALTDVTTFVIKIPAIIGDKYLC